VRAVSAERQLAEGRITQADLDEMKQVVLHRLDTARELAKEVKPRQKMPTFGGVWKGLGRAGADWSAKTQVSRDTLKKVIESLHTIPADFTVHPKLAKILEGRYEMVHSGKGIDWGCAEMLAIGSLLLEETKVRLTGQDVERGTFSHRHAVLHDYENGTQYYPLNNIDPAQAKFTVMNSMLSEFAVLGYEWGYASADPRILVMWEAQFGDFVNGAQPMLDQILAAAESKWRYMNGIVMLLPTATKAKAPSTATRTSSGSCRCAPRTTSR